MMNEEQKNPFKSLSPTNDVDNDVVIDALKFAIKQDDIKNIALSGPYGSGKSSVLKALSKKIEKEYFPLYVSLGKFKSHNADGTEYSEKQIERDIIQQIIYHENPNNLPLSRITRIKNLGNWRYFLAIIPFICLVLLLIEYHNPGFINLGFDFQKNNTLRIVLLSICFASAIPLLRHFVLIVKRTRIKKFCISSTDIEVEPTGDSPLNTYIDELLYFFEVTKYNVVIFEDIDRFNNNEVFVRLRQLNTLINNYANVGLSDSHRSAAFRALCWIFRYDWMRTLFAWVKRCVQSRVKKRNVKFLYAIKDDVFGEFERPKYFDMIIPVIPVVDRYNAGEKLNEEIKELKTAIWTQYPGVDQKWILSDLDASFLYDVGLFLNDMRLLKNIVNEFYVYEKTINKNFYDLIESGKALSVRPFFLDRKKIFSMVVFKNLCPREFDDLEKDKGLVWSIFSKPENIWGKEFDFWKDEISKGDFSDECFRKAFEGKVISIYNRRENCINETKQGEIGKNTKKKKTSAFDVPSNRGINFVTWAIENKYIDKLYKEYISIFYEGQLDEFGHAFLMRVKQNVAPNFFTQIEIKEGKNSCILDRINGDEWKRQGILNISFFKYILLKENLKQDKNHERLSSMVYAMYTFDQKCAKPEEMFFTCLLNHLPNESSLKGLFLQEMASTCDSPDFIKTFFLNSSPEVFWDFVNCIDGDKAQHVQEFYKRNSSCVEEHIVSYKKDMTGVLQKMSSIHLEFKLNERIVNKIGLDNILNYQLFTITKESLDLILLCSGCKVSALNGNYLTKCRSIDNASLKRKIDDNLSAIASILKQRTEVIVESLETVEYLFAASNGKISQEEKDSLFNQLDLRWGYIIAYYEKCGFSENLNAKILRELYSLFDIYDEDNPRISEFKTLAKTKIRSLLDILTQLLLQKEYQNELFEVQIFPFYKKNGFSVIESFAEFAIEDLKNVNPSRLEFMLMYAFSECRNHLQHPLFMKLIASCVGKFKELYEANWECLEQNDILYMLGYRDDELKDVKRCLLKKNPDVPRGAYSEDVYVSAIIECGYEQNINFRDYSHLISRLYNKDSMQLLKFVYYQYKNIPDISKREFGKMVKLTNFSRDNVYRKIKSEDPNFE